MCRRCGRSCVVAVACGAWKHCARRDEEFLRGGRVQPSYGYCALFDYFSGKFAALSCRGLLGRVGTGFCDFFHCDCDWISSKRFLGFEGESAIRTDATDWVCGLFVHGASIDGGDAVARRRDVERHVLFTGGVAARKGLTPTGVAHLTPRFAGGR